MLQVVLIQEFIETLEDAGEIVSVMAHKENDAFKVTDTMVFALDELANSSKKRKLSKVAPKRISVFPLDLLLSSLVP